MSEETSKVALKTIAASLLVLALSACSGGSSSNLTLTATPAIASFSGSYVFSATGTDPTDGDYGVVGSLVADGKGNITSAVADYNLGSGIDAGVPLTGTYTVSASSVTISLTDGKSTKDVITANIVTTTGSATITSFDGTGTGTIYSQNTSGFTPAGTYAFTIAGEGNFTVSGSGQMVIASGTAISSGALTYYDGSTTTNYTASGFLYTPAANGRGQGALVGKNLSYYVIGPKQIMMINLDPQALLLLPATKS